MAKAPKPTPAGPLQTFAVLRPIRHNGEDFAEGDLIELDKAAFDSLPEDALEGEWQEETAEG